MKYPNNNTVFISDQKHIRVVKNWSPEQGYNIDDRFPKRSYDVWATNLYGGNAQKIKDILAFADKAKYCHEWDDSSEDNIYRSVLMSKYGHVAVVRSDVWNPYTRSRYTNYTYPNDEYTLWHTNLSKKQANKICNAIRQAVDLSNITRQLELFKQEVI